jgi:hypothetical protein
MSSAANIAMLKMISGESSSGSAAGAFLVVCILYIFAVIATGITAYFTDDFLKDVITKVPGPGPGPGPSS